MRESVAVAPAAWLAVALLTGAAAGYLALASLYRLLLATSALVLLTTFVLAVVRPARAAQLVSFVLFSALGYVLVPSIASGGVPGPVLLVVILLVGGIVSRERSRPEHVRRFAVPVLLFVATLVLFALAGSLRGVAWVAIQNDLVPVVALLAFFPLAASLRDERAVNALATAVLVGVAVLSVVLLLEYVANLRLGYDRATWFARLIAREGVGGGPRVRPLGAQGALVPLAFVASFALVRGRGERARPLLAGLALGALATAALLVMYTRSLLIAAPVALLLYLLLVSPDRSRLARSLAGGAALVALTALLVSVVSGRGPGAAVEGLVARFSDLTTDVSFQQRSAENRAALEAFSEHPWIGHGLGADVSVAELAGRADPPGFFHTTYIGLLVKTGVVGTAVFVSFLLLVLVRCARQALSRAGPARHVLATAAAGLAAVLVASASEPYITTDVGYLYVAAVAAVTAFYESGDRHDASRAEDREAAARPRPSRGAIPIRSG